MEAYKWSKMTGKLEGIPALNTDTTSNKFCQAMSKKKGTICNVCYSWNMLKTFRKNAVPRFKSNSEYLSYKVHDYDYLPKVPSIIARFNGHGELINRNHLENLFRICENQPKTTFTLWTKMYWLVHKLIDSGREKPPNLILVYSNDTPNTIAPLPKYFDKVFNNITDDYSGDMSSNCDRKCIECMMCYTLDDKTTNIIERIK